MVLVYAGKIPKDINKLAEKYFSDLPKNSQHQFIPYKKTNHLKPKVAVHYKKSDQAHIMIGVEAVERNSPKKYAAEILGTILAESMSSRLFLQVRERRGLAYTINGGHIDYKDTGTFLIYAGLKLEKVYEGLEVILAELLKTASEKITVEELSKAKEMTRGRLALRCESTNFLAEHFGVEYVLDREIETFDEYLKKIDQVTLEDVQEIAKEFFKKEKFNLQVIGPFKSSKKFEKIFA